ADTHTHKHTKRGKFKDEILNSASSAIMKLAVEGQWHNQPGTLAIDLYSTSNPQSQSVSSF
ncbi:MAG: hypothetical protein MJE68_28375, partial [Proteobacteria bacterium]|nr:hypothetical protein [Pseudomonadota bacterium]